MLSVLTLPSTTPAQTQPLVGGNSILPGSKAKHLDTILGSSPLLPSSPHVSEPVASLCPWVSESGHCPPAPCPSVLNTTARLVFRYRWDQVTAGSKPCNGSHVMVTSGLCNPTLRAPSAALIPQSIALTLHHPSTSAFLKCGENSPSVPRTPPHPG